MSWKQVGFTSCRRIMIYKVAVGIYKGMPKLLERSSISVFPKTLSVLPSLQIRNIVYLCKKLQQQTITLKFNSEQMWNGKKNPQGICVHKI